MIEENTSGKSDDLSVLRVLMHNIKGLGASDMTDDFVLDDESEAL